MHWEVVTENLRYFMIGSYPREPLGGLGLSIYLALVASILAFFLGCLLGLCRLSKQPLLRIPASIYIEVVRGVPLLMLICWLYFFIPIMFGKTIPEARSALFAFILFSAAYMAEIVRAGVISIPGGQMEAARSTGLTHAQTMIYIILPQAFRNMIPSFVNQFVSLTKDTSLAYIIGVNELTYVATKVMNRTMNAPAEIFIFIAIVYFILCYGLTSASRWIEKRISAGRKQIG